MFDQACINSFLQRLRASDRPLMIKLQRTTFRKYQVVWKSLPCFVARAADPCQTIRLRQESHRLAHSRVGAAAVGSKLPFRVVS
jgi:hypothetical protein